MKARELGMTRAAARFLIHALKMKGFGWLPFIDAIRTFLRNPRSEAELAFELPYLE